jgi:hypothetical protein
MNSTKLVAAILAVTTTVVMLVGISGLTTHAETLATASTTTYVATGEKTVVVVSRAA